MLSASEPHTFLRKSTPADAVIAGVDEDDELLATRGRTREQDQRIAVHECGYAISAWLLGHEVGDVTVNEIAIGQRPFRERFRMANTPVQPLVTAGGILVSRGM